MMATVLNAMAEHTKRIYELVRVRIKGNQTPFNEVFLAAFRAELAHERCGEAIACSSIWVLTFALPAAQSNLFGTSGRRWCSQALQAGT